MDASDTKRTVHSESVGNMWPQVHSGHVPRSTKIPMWNVWETDVFESETMTFIITLGCNMLYLVKLHKASLILTYVLGYMRSPGVRWTTRNK